MEHLSLSEQGLQGDITILIERAKAGQTPYLYRSFAELNARPAFIPECALLFLDAPLNFLNMFTSAGIQECVVRNSLVPIVAADATLPPWGKTWAYLYEALRSTLHEIEALLAANPYFDYDQMRHHHPLFGVQTAPQLLQTLWQHQQAYRDQIASDLTIPQFPKAS